MVLRNLRWLSAGVLAAAAMLAAPSRSAAETLVLIQELDASNNVVAGTSATFNLATLPTSSNPYSPVGGSFAGISVSVTSTSGVLSDVNSLTTQVAAKPSGSFDSGHQLQVVVTDDGFLNSNAGGSATVDNNAGASSGISGGVNNISGTTAVLSGTLATTLTGLGTTAAANDVRPGSSSTNDSTTSIVNLPGQYAITQTITVRAVENSPGSISANSTFGGTLSTTMTTAPAAVPAPAGLVLALAAVPVLGLRRLLRRKATA
jgi:hypothetical protein